MFAFCCHAGTEKISSVTDAPTPFVGECSSSVHTELEDFPNTCTDWTCLNLLSHSIIRELPQGNCAASPCIRRVDCLQIHPSVHNSWSTAELQLTGELLNWIKALVHGIHLGLRGSYQAPNSGVSTSSVFERLM